MTREEIDYEDFEKRYPPVLVKLLKMELAGGGIKDLTAAQLATVLPGDGSAAQQLLDELANQGTLERKLRRVCPHCKRTVEPEDVEAGVCPYDPQVAFSDYEAKVEEEFFQYTTPRSRDVEWVLALHGMNTPGAWQEDFNWLVSRTYGRMIPVKIYKYGRVLSGAVLRFLQRRHARTLIKRIQTFTGEAERGGFGPRPDVIAHSFGTWLLGHALQEEPNLKVGRVILTGSILKPDFPWQELRDAGRVEAVLNHFGTRDVWAWIAQYLIPDSGPSGRVGFDDPGALNVPAKDFTHSQFFTDEKMPELFRPEEPKGLWHDFLTAAPEELPKLAGPSKVPRPGWKPVVWPLRATIPRFLLLAGVAALLALLVAAEGLGLADLWRLASSPR